MRRCLSLVFLVALAGTVQAANEWPQLKPGTVTEVKGYLTLPDQIKAVPELSNCTSSAGTDQCPEMVSRFYQVGDAKFALVPIDGLFDLELLFSFSDNEVTQLSVATYGAELGFATTKILGEVKLDAKSGELTSTFFEDSCDAETTTSESTYAVVEGSYYLQQMRQGLGCENTEWKTLWTVKK
jgi:hypothetical protein